MYLVLNVFWVVATENLDPFISLRNCNTSAVSVEVKMVLKNAENDKKVNCVIHTP